MSALLVYSACPDIDTAQRIADALVEERLAACVNVVPGVRSIYRWKGTIECGNEVLLLVKTVAAQLQAVSARIVALHPHELPEVIAVEASGGLSAYLDWVAECSNEDRVGD